MPTVDHTTRSKGPGARGTGTPHAAAACCSPPGLPLIADALSPWLGSRAATRHRDLGLGGTEDARRTAARRPTHQAPSHVSHSARGAGHRTPPHAGCPEAAPTRCRLRADVPCLLALEQQREAFGFFYRWRCKQKAD